RREEVAAETDEHLDLALVHRFDRTDGVETLLLRRLEMELARQAGQILGAHLLPDTHGAIALHVAVTANWSNTGASPADVAAQQREVHDRLHVGDAVLVLGDAHRPGTDHTLRRNRDVGRLTDHLARDTALLNDPIPRLAANVGRERLEAFGMVFDEVV